MAKETFYFSHDYNSRSDKELIKVVMKMGMSGIGIYWCIVEMLYEEGGYLLRTECERIAFELRTDVGSITQIIETFNLFKIDSDKFWSDSVLHRLEIRDEKSAKARKSAFKRWENADALQTQSDANAIKERKGKENKEKDIIATPNFDKGNLVVYNAEIEILKNPIWLEKICMNNQKNVEDGKACLHKYHLYLEEKEQYPRTKKSVIAGFEKWLINDKQFSKNGQHTTSTTGKEIKFDKF